MVEGQRDGEEIPEQVTSEIFTAANVVSFVRLCLVPVYLWLLLSGFNLAATLVFAAAAASDFIDGQLARRTHTVSKLGQILDPAVDRILMITGVLGVFLVGRIPLWVIVVVVLRDAYLLIGGAWLLSRYRIRVPVVYPGKFATTFLFIGFAGLLLNAPLIPGLGWCDISWLPGFNGEAVSWGIWFIYAGLILSLGVTIYYTVAAARALARRAETPQGGRFGKFERPWRRVGPPTSVRAARSAVRGRGPSGASSCLRTAFLVRRAPFDRPLPQQRSLPLLDPPHPHLVRRRGPQQDRRALRRQ